MKIDLTEFGAAKVRVPRAALDVLGHGPTFVEKEGSYFTSRGALVVPLGSGWAWLSRFDRRDDLLLQDLADLERAEAALPKRKLA